MLVTHRARMSGKLDSKKDSHSTKFERRPRIFAKLSFRELCDLKLSVLHLFDNMTIIHSIKNRSKTENCDVNSWDTNPGLLLFFLFFIFYPCWEIICCNILHPGTSEISTPPEKAVGAHFYAWHGTKTAPIFLHANGEASWSLLPSLVYLQFGGTVQPENNYSCILKVTGQVWESQKRIIINTNHRYHQHSSP